jgi:hypothetical protein
MDLDNRNSDRNSTLYTPRHFGAPWVSSSLCIGRALRAADEAQLPRQLVRGLSDTTAHGNFGLQLVNPLLYIRYFATPAAASRFALSFTSCSSCKCSW